MSELRVLRSLVTQSLSAAAQQILEFVERMLLTSEMSPEQQLSAAADEILKILENWMDRLLLSAPSEQQRCEQCRSSSPSVRPQFKDAATETDAELIHGKPSHLHQTQNTEKSSATSLEAETPGERCGAPSSDSEIPSSANPKAVSEGGFQESLKSNKRRTCRRLRQNQDCSKACERSSHKDAAEQKMNISPANKNQTTGQSCCRVCGKFFWYKRSFLKHVLKHEQVADLCGVCGKRLASVESLKVHLQAHNEENSCRDKTDEGQSSSECSDTENKVSDSDEDWKESDSSRDGDNDETNKSNARKRAKKKHHKDVSHLKYCCKVCGKTFCYRASFLKHVQEEERDTDVCGVCGKRFESEQRLRLHMQTYIRTNDCEVCGKHFEGLKQLEMHMRTHTGEKPYVCSFCGKAFAQNGNLIGHMRVHTGEKPYACSVCGQSFSFKEYMMAHMRIHTGEKPFLCSVCGKGFRQRGTLKTHMMIHTGESTHRCLICDKTFYKSGALKIHMRSHTGEKPYLCNVCGKRFPAGSSLTKHMGVHEGRRAHCCSVCGEGCLRKEDLRKHLQTHRNESTQLISL